MTPTLYLHWTATPYDWIRSGLENAAADRADLAF